ncbi:MAG: glycosyltransferase, partial [Desulfobacterota bacterium]|nr:glycosyltransferase [Thermodesulfobacteriota bacterium]
MKVLLVTTSYPDFPGSNRGIFIRLTPRIHAQSPLFEDDDGIMVHRFRFPSGNRPLNQMESIPVYPMAVYMLSGLTRALLLTARWRPHVIHGNWIVPTGLIAAFAGRVFRVPVLNTARGMDLRISERQP